MKVDNKGELVKEAADTNIDISQISTSKTSGKFANPKLPDTIVIHYTAGSSANGAIATLTNPEVKASAHIVVDNDGTITQLIPFTHVGWHAGKSKYGDRVGLNKFSVGIEIVNPGFLSKMEDGTFKTQFGKGINSSDVEQKTHRNQLTPKYWHTYSDIQIEIVKKICFALKAAYSIQFVVGHEEIAPQRKTDPGPCFPLDSLRSEVLGHRSFDNDDHFDSGVVSVDNLNIRNNADPNATKVALPLKRNSRVEILEEKNGWYKVNTEVEGWVASKFIKQ